MSRSLNLAVESVVISPGMSTFTRFAKAIRGKGFGRTTIQRGFNEWVDKDEYDPAEKKDIIDYLVGLSKPEK